MTYSKTLWKLLGLALFCAALTAAGCSDESSAREDGGTRDASGDGTAADPCENNGPCVEGLCFPDDDGYYCDCNEGYSGALCNQDVNECDYAVCQNASNCENGPGGYICHCAPGWTDINCDMDIDECEDNPCMNDGVCENLPGNFMCHCIPPYEGWLCHLGGD